MIIRPGRGRGCCVVILCSHNADHNKRRTALCDTSWNIKAKIKISFHLNVLNQLNYVYLFISYVYKFQTHIICRYLIGTSSCDLAYPTARIPLYRDRYRAHNWSVLYYRLLEIWSICSDELKHISYIICVPMIHLQLCARKLWIAIYNVQLLILLSWYIILYTEWFTNFFFQ